MSESIVRFGPERSLVGILSEPHPGGPAGRPAVIVPNAGVLHRVGPFRLHVDLARALAKEGFPVLRFDLSGLGDSAPRHEEPDEGSRFRSDVISAMEYLERRKGVESFVVGGLCSGADLAHELALSCESVVGAFFLDGYGYVTPGYKLRAFAGRATNLALWRRALGRRISALRGSAAAEAGEGEDLESYIRSFPPIERFKKDVTALVARNVKLLYVYTSGSSHYYNYRSQFRDMLGLSTLPASLRVELYPLADHTFSLASDRRLLLRRLGSWARSELCADSRAAEHGEALEPAYAMPGARTVTAAEKP